ncbi:cell division protein FtsX [Amaricoccus macauensis]|uniref:cell division protein FtsX n=1 Tax=Amaricoccus macauensis TaxID=57001 RepID=UPI003C7CED00
MRWLYRSDSAEATLPPITRLLRPLRLATAVLAFLATLLLALGLTGVRFENAFGGPRAQSATLQIVADGASIEAEARAALEVLRLTEGVLSVRMIEIEEQRALLESWLGAGASIEDLPLPLMIDVTIDPTRLDIPGLEGRLAVEAPNATFDDHGSLRSELATVSRWLGLFAFATVALVALALAAVFRLASHAAVLGCRDAIRTLRLIGARDGFVSRILARRLTRAAVYASVTGTLAGLLLLMALPAQSSSGFFLVAIAPHGLEWIAPCLVPLVAAPLSWFCARQTLRRMIRTWS